MFLNSEIAKKFSLGKTKSMYMVNFSTTLFFKIRVEENVEFSGQYSVL